MKNKGFTLVELLAVILILSLIMTITVVNVAKSRENALDAISEQEKKNLKEAARMVALNLDDLQDDLKCTAGWITCDNNAKWTEAEFTINALREHGYLQDDDNHCTGSLSVTKADGEYTVELNGVTCDGR